MIAANILVIAGIISFGLFDYPAGHEFRVEFVRAEFKFDNDKSCSFPVAKKSIFGKSQEYIIEVLAEKVARECKEELLHRGKPI